MKSDHNYKRTSWICKTRRSHVFTRGGSERENELQSVSVRFSGESWRAPVARWFYARNDWELSINGVREMENTSAFADFTLGFIVFR